MRMWEESLHKRLAASPEYAAEYLNAVLEENDSQAFLLALRHVAEKSGGLRKLANDADGRLDYWMKKYERRDKK